jgi:hypothetical protein
VLLLWDRSHPSCCVLCPAVDPSRAGCSSLLDLLLWDILFLNQLVVIVGVPGAPMLLVLNRRGAAVMLLLSTGLNASSLLCCFSMIFIVLGFSADSLLLIKPKKEEDKAKCPCLRFVCVDNSRKHVRNTCQAGLAEHLALLRDSKTRAFGGCSKSNFVSACNT